MINIKLTDKEINAVAKRIRDKQDKVRRDKLQTLAKGKVAEAKKVMTYLTDLPEPVQELVLQYQFRTGSKRSLSGLAECLVAKDMLPGVQDVTIIEADVVLAAKECSSLSALYKKLGL